MKILNGGIKVENTNLRSLSFFSAGKDEEWFGFDCMLYGLTIRNNSLLTDVRMLWNISYYQSDSTECPITIQNNEKLDVGNLCAYGFLYTVFGIKVSGNIRDCGCEGKICKVSFNGLTILNGSDASSMNEITETRGDINIQNTNFQNLSFFKNLETFKVSKSGSDATVAINIKNNFEMTRFGIPSLKTIQNIWPSEIYGNLENLNPSFCLTIEELVLFLEHKIFFVNIHASICEDPGVLHGSKLCKSKTMETLETSCDYILGDVIIESGDEVDVKKLKKVTHLFGSLIVRNTTLSNLNFLSNLKYMVQMSSASMPIAQIISNPKMAEPMLSGMQHVISKNPDFYVLLHDNHPKKVGNFFFGFDFPYFENFNGGPWGCPGDKLNILGMDFYRSCTLLSKNLNLNNFTDSLDLSALSKIEKIKGEIEMSYSNLQNLSFLENLETLDFDNLYLSGMNLNIHHNYEMTKLGLNSLKKIVYTYPVTINLEQLHPDFCVSIQEMLVFLEASAYFHYFHAKLCDFNESDIKVKTCKLEKLEVLESDCVYLVGDLSIQNGDEEYVEKLNKVKIVFGSLSIQNTELEDVKFLGKLRKIANLNGPESSPVIQLINNKKLKNIEPLKIDVTISKWYSTAVIDGNNVFDSTKKCMIFQYNTRTNVTYNGGNCRSISAVSSGTMNSYSFLVEASIAILFLVFLIK